ncbi:hypothetical protein ACFSUK_07980 [Sphingobium scionense]
MMKVTMANKVKPAHSKCEHCTDRGCAIYADLGSLRDIRMSVAGDTAIAGAGASRRDAARPMRRRDRFELRRHTAGALRLSFILEKGADATMAALLGQGRT